MGVSSRRRSIRPPLPAPTDSMDEGGTSGIDTDVATTITTRTDKSSYELPADGSPITISTQTIASKKEGGNGGHARKKSQTSTSLLIEYFEGSSTGDRAKSRPTVRVKVSQDPKKRSGSGAHDAVQITGIGEDRKPSYTRRISLGSSRRAEIATTNTEAAEDRSLESASSHHPPVEIEVLDHNGSDLSTRSRGLAYNAVECNVSSMPPDSMLEGNEGKRSRSFDQNDDITVKDGTYLDEPDKGRSRSRSAERITQKVMERLNRPPSAPLKSGKSRSERSLGKQYDVERYPQGSDVSNNPRLLGLVQDTIKNYILPEIQAAKQDQRSGRSPRSAHNSRRSSGDDGLVRRVSKSSSSPNIASKPRVVLNREGDDPGTTLARGDSERKTRKSSGGSYHSDREKASRSTTSLRDAGAASVGAGILTAANLEKHDSRSDGYERRRKRRSKSRGSRSRSTGATETGDGIYTSKDEIPPLPLAGDVDDSELTRDSLVSEKGHSRASAETRTPIREVSRGSLARQSGSPPIASRTPIRTPLNRNLGMSRENISIESPRSPEAGISNKERIAALGAAGVTGAAVAAGAEEMYRHHVDADGYGTTSPGMRKISSPVQSVSSLRKNFEDDTFATKESRPRSAASRSSAGRLHDKRGSQTSLPSGTSSPLGRSARRSPNTLAGAQEVARSPGTPTVGENLDDFYEQQHRLNDEYRQSYMSESPNRDSFRATNRDSYQTNPYPQDEKRWTMFTDDSPVDLTTSGEKDLQNIGAANPEYVHTPHGAESAVASLMELSSVSSGSPTKASYRERMSAHLREMGGDSPPMYQGSTLSQTMPSQDRWTAIKRHAQSTSGSTPKIGARSVDSPRQSPARSPERSLDTKAIVGASGLPLADDPMPEIGHYDDSRSEVSTNQSIVKGPLGGDVTGKDTWPYTPEPASPGAKTASARDSRSLRSDASKEDTMLAAAAAGSAALATGYAARNATVDDDREERDFAPGIRQSKSRSPIPPRNRDYVADTPTRSAGSLTPDAEQKQFSKADVEEFNRAMDAQPVDERDDPFSADIKRARHISANSHGMASPIYDSSTGKGKDYIQSKDIVALMDHLTVRDAQKNAIDTEIIVTLVRSAAEMKQSFDEMKKFILEQDRMIMENTNRSADSTAQKVLGGPRAIPARSTGYIGTQSQEDIQTKRKGVLRRALRGLTGSKSSNDLAKVEGMLMQILENMEDLKHQGGSAGGPRGTSASHTNDSLDEYERMRSAPDPGYDGQSPSSDSSTPRQSPQNLAFTPREKQQFHSGYDGRRGSMNRVSTVMEGDEDDELDEHDPYLADIPIDDGERLLTPTQEAYRQRAISPNFTPPPAQAASNDMLEDVTPRSAQRKHQSNNSLMFGGAKVSRWSKTTSSSAAPDPAHLDSPRGMPRNAKAPSEASRSGSTLLRYDEEGYELKDDDRLRSTQSLAREQEEAGRRSVRSLGSKITRTPSPLIPSEASSTRQHDEYEYEYARGTSPLQEDLDPEFDDPKYQAVRNSLLLQHPQPRPGATGRHQNTLESQAHDFDDLTGTNSDLSQKTVSDFDPAMWGSSGTAGLAKHRLSQFEPLSPVSMNSPGGYGGGNRSSGAAGGNEAPLVPPKVPPIPPKIQHDEPEYDDWEEPQYSNSGFSRGGYYSSPFGSGHLLEPIQEVRYSLETDSGHISPEPEIASAQAVNMRSAARKITGPRPMGTTRLASAEQQQPRLVETSGTVRRKPLSSY